MDVQVSDQETGSSLPQGMAGISLEATDLADPDLSRDNTSMVKLLSEVDGPVLRFGGNAVDRRFFWTSSGEKAPSSYKGDKAHPVRAVGPDDLNRLNGLLQATDARVALTVDLGHYDPVRAADMAKHAQSILGDRLLSITIGNEPNGYGTNGLRPGGYTPEDYVKELQAYAEEIHAVAPNVAIAGPGAYSQAWWGPFIEADIPQKKIFTFHNYPLYSCDGKTDPTASPTIANLMSPLMHQRAEDYQKAALNAAKEAGLETWLPETGIAACPGSNETSRTHASALWTADYVLNAARLGITRIGFHSSLLTCMGGPPMSMLCSGGAYLQPNGEFKARANFFGLAIVSDLEGGKFVDTQSSGGGLAFSYGLKNSDGSTSLVIVNQNDPAVAAQTDIKITLPGQPLTGTMTQLSGPSFDAEDKTVIDGGDSGPVPVSERLTVPGFQYGSSEQSIKLTAGTVTVLNFTY
ncbi:Glycosyl hydrolase family 79, N-terminal domain [Pseudarthrobacter enclensis]|nr:hypothetical protein [Pseudarthrobacter enclensis]SCB74952.1 Glycosyl hydrolase family 79, N-terminal domain [Pseudarthrobacter enclensis]